MCQIGPKISKYQTGFFFQHPLDLEDMYPLIPITDDQFPQKALSLYSLAVFIQNLDDHDQFKKMTRSWISTNNLINMLHSLALYFIR